MYTVSQIKLSIFQDKRELRNKIAKKFRVSVDDIIDIKIIRESIDARNKKDIKLVYTVDFNCNKKINADKAPDRKYILPQNILKKDERPVVIGFGPAGIFSALILAKQGYRPIVLERGKDVDRRSEDVEKFWKEEILDEESNVQFGEGGAGTFSDGKLTTNIKDYRIGKVLEELYKNGAKEEILYKQKPHIGTDKLKEIIKNIRNEIISLGGEVRFSNKVLSPILDKKEDGYKLVGLKVKRGSEIYELQCSKCVFAIGHSSRDTFQEFFNKGLEMMQKPISIGLRVEHLQEMIDESQYGDKKIAKILGSAEYKLSHRTESGRGVYTFCMCPGGEVIMSSSQKNTIVSNGMSYSQRDGKYANSAVLVDVRTEDYNSNHSLAGFDFQEKYEKLAYKLNKSYKLIECRLEELEDSLFCEVLPKFALDCIREGMTAFGKKIKGFDDENTILKGIETRSSSPVRVSRDSSFQSNIKGLYPAGEGPGYAGGIMSAAVDGIRVAESIIEDRKYEKR